MNTESNIVTIVMPVYNGSKYINRSIQSVIDQRYTHWELICVNDSSTDNSLEVLNELSQADKRIKVFTKPNEKFGNRATKYGIELASGKYFMYMSQDDILSDDLLEKGVQAFADSELDAVVPQMKYYNIATGDTTDFKIHTTQSIISGKEAFELSLDWRIHGFVLWKMELVKLVGWGTETLNDDEYTTRMLYWNSSKVGFSTGIFYYHNANADAITVKWSPDLLDFVKTSAKLNAFTKTNQCAPALVQTTCTVLKNDLTRAIILFINNYPRLSKQQRADGLSRIETCHKQYSKLIKQSTMSSKESMLFSNTLVMNSIIRLKCLLSK